MLDLVHQSSDERVAILLRALGPELGEQILTVFSDERTSQLRKTMRELDTEGVDSELEGEVLDEFERFLRFATENKPSPENDPALQIANTGDEGNTAPGAAAGQSKEAAAKKEEPRKPFVPTGDPIADLMQLSSYQISTALESEHPRTAALVLKQLDSETAAKVLPLLPEASRSDVFLQMNREDSSSPQLIARIVKTTLDNALQIEEPEGEELDADGRAAALLRSLDKSARNEMLDALQAEDAEMAERVRALLYEFEDILKLTGRSVQKLLGEFDIDTLSAALKGADQALADQVQANLSRRARERLIEEMELATPDPDAIEAARKEIAGAMGRLDAAGDLQMA
ncbi:MAG: FliG C-terminal domain-containing protein [Planctomycetaceae bacterium]